LKDHVKMKVKQNKTCAEGCKCEEARDEFPALSDAETKPNEHDEIIADPSTPGIFWKLLDGIWTPQSNSGIAALSQDANRLSEEHRQLEELRRNTVHNYDKTSASWAAGIGLPKPAVGLKEDATRTKKIESGIGLPKPAVGLQGDATRTKKIECGIGLPKPAVGLQGDATRTKGRKSRWGSKATENGEKGGDNASAKSILKPTLKKQVSHNSTPKTVVFNASPNSHSASDVLHNNKSVGVVEDPSRGRSSNKPESQSAALSPPQWANAASRLLTECESLSPQQAKEKLMAMARKIEEKERHDWWTSDEGQEQLKQIENQRRLNILQYTSASTASLCPVTSPTEDWIEVELTADTGACDTVIPKSMAPGIPITPSFQSLRQMEYEVATGASIPNLGEKKCEMWTEGASQPKRIDMQVADVHKALLSLSRCADAGFESRFGARMGCLIDSTTGEVIPLTRRGNLYVLRCWIRAAPFGRQEGPM
jgi:hypothetical protein